MINALYLKAPWLIHTSVAIQVNVIQNRRARCIQSRLLPVAVSTRAEMDALVMDSVETSEPAK